MVIPGPAVQQVRHGFLLQGQALLDTAGLVASGLRAARQDDSFSVPPRLRFLADELAEAARDLAELGRVKALEPDNASSSAVDELLEELTVTEAAHMLGISTRHTRRLAPHLGGRRAAAGWLISRGSIRAHLHERNH